MSADSKLSFAKPSTSKAELEEGTAFTPRFDEHGLIGAIVMGADGVVLMFAFMNAEALRLTIETGEAHFYSRSRKSLWKKGETSGNVLRVRELLTDCDQDMLLVKVELQGEAACHTGRHSCFYRRVEAGADGVALEFVTK
jgi:phosphoribosyl-AMP cyclohydrolase